jgi:hypothetical protein
MPENCHCAFGGKKLRYDSRTWARDVAHEPPRKTIWLTIYANQVGAKQEGDKKIVSTCALKALYVTPDQKSPWDE